MASISLTIWPLAIPPIAGLQLIWAMVCIFMVISRTLAPRLAAAAAASQPAWPAPTTIMSYLGNIGQRYGKDGKSFVPRGTTDGGRRERFHVEHRWSAFGGSVLFWPRITQIYTDCRLRRTGHGNIFWTCMTRPRA